MGILKSPGCPEHLIQVLQDFLTAVSRSASVFLPETSSLPACSVRAARAVVVVAVSPRRSHAQVANSSFGRRSRRTLGRLIPGGLWRLGCRRTVRLGLRCERSVRFRLVRCGLRVLLLLCPWVRGGRTAQVANARWAAESSGRWVGSFRVGSGRLFGWAAGHDSARGCAVGGRFGSALFGSGWFGRAEGARFDSG